MLRQCLATGGLLVRRLGGPSSNPTPTDLGGKNRPAGKYDPTGVKTVTRRSLYTYWKRTVLRPLDDGVYAADPEHNCTVRRQSRASAAGVGGKYPQFVGPAFGRTLPREGGRHSRIASLHVGLTDAGTTSKELAVLPVHEEQLDLRIQPGEALALVQWRRQTSAGLTSGELAAVLWWPARC